MLWNGSWQRYNTKRGEGIWCRSPKAAAPLIYSAACLWGGQSSVDSAVGTTEEGIRFCIIVTGRRMYPPSEYYCCAPLATAHSTVANNVEKGGGHTRRGWRRQLALEWRGRGGDVACVEPFGEKNVRTVGGLNNRNVGWRVVDANRLIISHNQTGASGSCEAMNVRVPRIRCTCMFRTVFGQHNTNRQTSCTCFQARLHCTSGGATQKLYHVALEVPTLRRIAAPAARGVIMLCFISVDRWMFVRNFRTWVRVNWTFPDWVESWEKRLMFTRGVPGKMMA